MASSIQAKPRIAMAVINGRRSYMLSYLPIGPTKHKNALGYVLIIKSISLMTRHAFNQTFTKQKCEVQSLLVPVFAYSLYRGVEIAKFYTCPRTSKWP